MSGDEKKISANQEIQTEIAIVDERTIRDKIYVIRGQKVMLDFELAEIYGYSTSRFNEQVSNNIEKIAGDDFCFYLTQDEFKELKNLISKKSTSSWGGRRKPPRAFCESGIYMLMTVLRGDLATAQSRALIRIFRSMRDYIVETQGIVTQRDILRLSMQTAENATAIQNMHTMVAEQQKLINDQQKMLLEHDDKLIDAYERINETVKKSDLSPVFLQFQQEEQTEFLLLNGHPVQADLTYMDIYSKAQKSVYVIDDYISLKTLNLLQTVKPGVAVTVFSDNQYNKLHASEYANFQTEFPSIPIQLITTGGIVHADEHLSDDDGIVPAFTGLKNGTYTLVEKTVPAGYNKLDDHTFTIADDDYTNTNLTQSETVVNNQGTTLPSTGGIGTTIFYILGGLLVVGAAVILVARRKAQD